MGRLPTKNCVNMHDIIGQPLGALSDAVDAVLRRPEPLDDLEISSIFHESSFLLLRAEEALAAREEDAFAALFRLMSEGLSRNEASYEEGIKTFALDGQLLQTIHSLFTSVVENGGLPLHSTGVTEITQVVSSLCDGEAIRDSCGSVFLSTLLSIFEQIRTNADAAAHHFHVQRAAATALINLVKGSKANKQRLSQVALIGECCVASVDVFFQLQCVELLFRLSRQKKGLLDSLEVVMPGKTVQHLRDLPNDSTLLPRMAAAVEAMNANRADVLHFKLGPVAAGETVLTEVTDAFFTPHFMTIMITTSNADNITIPYCIIRSVTLGKDGRILVRLEEFPVKLEALLSHTPGMDTVTLHMTASRLNAFKQSSVKQWIVAALQIRTREQRIQAVKVGATDVIGTKRRSCSVDATGPEPDGDANSTLEVVNAAAAEGKRWTRTPERHPISPGKSIATTDQRAKRSAPAPEAQQFAQLLKQRIDADAEDRRGNGTAELNRIMAAIQSTVDSARQRADSHRRGFQQQLGSEIDHLEQHIHQTQEYASSAVNQLNGNLGSVKCSNTALNERIACLEMGLQQLLEESRLAEARQLREVATQCSYNDCVDAMAGEKAGTMQYRSAPLQKLHAF